MMSSSVLKMVLLNSYFLTFIVGLTVTLFFCLAVIPWTQALSVYDKKKWLQKQFSKLELMSADQIVLKNKIKK